MDWASNFEIKPVDSASLRELVELTVSTYRTRTGKSLHASLERGTPDVPKTVWAAPLCVMVVRASEADGTIVTYANPAAAEAHGLTAGDGYKALIESATTLPAALSEKKYESGYAKKVQLRAAVAAAAEAAAADEAVSAEGGSAGSFTVRGAERWALEKMTVVDGKLANEPVGLAYAWDCWELSDGTTCEPGGKRKAPTGEPADAQAAVDAQAEAVRALKASGLTNADDEVQEAVAELKRLKAKLPPPEDE